MMVNTDAEKHRLLERAHAIYAMAIKCLNESKYGDLFTLMMERSSVLGQIQITIESLSDTEIQQLKDDSLHLIDSIQETSNEVAKSLQAATETVQARLAYAQAQAVSDSNQRLK